MLLKHLAVRNFRSIACEDFDFGSFGVLIGKNNSGKSNVLAAISLLLEGSAKDLSRRDFHSMAAPIELEGVLSPVRAILPLSEEKHRAKIEKCILPDDSIRIRRTSEPSVPALGRLEIWDPEKSSFGTPTGLDAGLRQILPEVILVEVFVDPASEAEGRDAATLGKILKVILDGVRAETDEAVRDSMAKANALLNVVLDEQGTASDSRASGLRDVETSVSRHLGEAFQGSAVRLRIDLPELPSLLGKARVEVSDGDRWTEPRLKGQGQQRALYVALLRTLAEQKRRSTTETLARPFILLMEEPEAFLHPTGHGVLRRTLETISASGQVLLTTHSPTMVAPNQMKSTILLRKRPQDGGGLGTEKLHSVGEELVGKDKRIRHLFEYARSSKFLFADRVVIVEGPSDAELLDALCSRLRGRNLEDCGIACVDAGSKDVVKECVDIVTQIGFNARAVVDLDYLWKGAGVLFGSDAAYSQFCATFRGKCETVGIVARGEGTLRPDAKARAVELVRRELREEADRLREQASRQHNVWILGEGEIEAYVGLSASSKGGYSECAMEIRSGERAIAHEDEMARLLDWIGADLGGWSTQVDRSVREPGSLQVAAP